MLEEGTELLGIDDDGTVLLGNDDDGIELLGSDDDGAELLGTDDDGTELLGIDDDGTELLGTDDDDGIKQFPPSYDHWPLEHAVQFRLLPTRPFEEYPASQVQVEDSEVDVEPKGQAKHDGPPITSL